MNMCNITYEVPRLSTFVFKKFSEKNRFTIIYVVKSLRGFGWDNIGPGNWANVSCYPGSGISGVKRFCLKHSNRPGPRSTGTPFQVVMIL